MPGYLVAEEGPLSGLIIRMEKGSEWILGRDPEGSFQVLEDPTVSRKHLICRITDEGFVVENLSATNPASVNGQNITDPVHLQEGDMLRIGNTLFRFTESDPSGSLPDASTSHPTIFEEESPLDSLSFSSTNDSRWMFKVISGPNTGAELGLEENKTYIAGKDPHSCDIIFQDLSVSRQHAKIFFDNDTVKIEDLKSRNGTYVNGHAIEGIKPLVSQDVVSLGTTSFILIDREQTRETIYSPASAFVSSAEENDAFNSTDGSAENKNSWKDMFIPTRHLIVAGVFGLLLIVGVVSTLSLFKSQPILVSKVDDHKLLEEVFKRFPAVQYTFSEGTGKIFLLGDVLTAVEKQELLYLVRALPFISSIDDNIVVNEVVWNDMNAFIAKNPNWRAVTMTAITPGKFLLRGYVQTMQEATALLEFVTKHFPYQERLENEVVVADTLEIQIQSLLAQKGFMNVTFELSSGELVLTGRVNHQEEREFDTTLADLKKLSGIRNIKNFVIITTASTARINISDKYKVSGTSKLGSLYQYIVINGQILAANDLLDGMTITDIDSDSILLEKDGLKYRINYNLQ